MVLLIFFFNELGQRIDDDHKMEKIAVSYFTHIFQPQVQFSYIGNILITRMLFETDIHYLSICFAKDEVLYALKHIHPQKAPGPDSMHACFFRNIGIL